MTEEAAQVWRLWSAVRESTAALAGSSQLAAALGRAAEDETRVCGLQERMGPWTRCHGLWEAFRTVVSEGMRNTKRADVVNIDGKVGVEDEIHGLLLARHCAYTCDRDGGNCERRQCWPSHREPRVSTATKPTITRDAYAVADGPRNRAHTQKRFTFSELFDIELIFHIVAPACVPRWEKCFLLVFFFRPKNMCF